MVLPARDVDYRDAEKTLKLWLEEQDMQIRNCRDWTRWTYTAIPFWSVWGIVSGMGTLGFKTCGIHIHDDGEILIVVEDPALWDSVFN